MIREVDRAEMVSTLLLNYGVIAVPPQKPPFWRFWQRGAYKKAMESYFHNCADIMHRLPTHANRIEWPRLSRD